MRPPPQSATPGPATACTASMLVEQGRTRVAPGGFGLLLGRFWAGGAKLLEVTMVAGPGTCFFAPTELSIAWPSGVQPADCSGLSLHRALAQCRPGHFFTVGGETLDGLIAGKAPLVNGAVIVALPDGASFASAPAPPTSFDEGIAAVLSVCSGPGAGAVFALHRGTHTVGRGQCRIPVADPALSRHHGTLHVGSRNITLTAARGSSGFALRQADGRAEPVKGTVVLEVGHIIACGDSTLELRLPDAGLAESGPGAGNRSALLLDPGVLEPLPVQSIQGAARNKAAMLVAGALPLVLGVVLALLTGSWMFLAFSAMGAMAVLVPLLGGSKRRKAFHAAVALATARDAERRLHTFPDAGSLMLASRTDTPGLPHGRAGPATRAVALRLGTAAQHAAVAVSPDDPSFTAPLVHGLPLAVPLGPDPVSVRGPSAAVLSLLNYALMQLDAAAVPVILFGSPDTIPMAARFLPRTVLAASHSSAAGALGMLCRGAASGERPPAVLVAVNVPVADLVASMPGLQVLHFAGLGQGSPDSPAGGPAMAGTGSAGAAPSRKVRAGKARAGSTAAGPATAVLKAAGNHVLGTFAGQDFIPDGVPAAVFDAYARRRARQDGNTAGGGASDPSGHGFLAANTLPRPGQCTVSSVVKGWSLAAGGQLRPVAIGESAAGPVMFDFLRDGPHLLVGGTTGSGKSEMLRTLAGSLATAHSPADLQFVFMDFKGGAGLGVLGKLPHTASLITDLGGHGMDRTLASLRAELHHREAALAAVEAADSQAYRAKIREHASFSNGHGMAHLVVVVDEFRVLVDQFPDAMAELMRIAAVGRSLGIHLVMATQRPQGAVNADIRANVTSSICLRVQSSFDSTDVIGTAVAATISVGTPGRAYISRAGAAPEEFQSATLRLPAPAPAELPAVQLVRGMLAADPAVTDGSGNQESDVSAVAGLLAEAWREARAQQPELRAAPAVVAQALPAELNAADAGWTWPGGAGIGGAGDALDHGVMLGIVDVPQNQSLEPLLWHPRLYSHLAFFGTSPETTNAVGLVAAQLLSAGAEAPETAPCLLYLLDGDGSLGPWAANRQVGACITPGHLRTAAHLVQRLAQTARVSPGTFVLCISDWGRWVTALRSSPWHEAEDAIAELIRFSAPNVVVVLGGGRELLTAPFLASIPNRVYLSCGSSAESTMLWPRIPRFNPVPGRAAIAGPINEQASHAGPGQGDPDALHIAQLGRPARAGVSVASRPGAGSCAADVLVVTPLPQSLSLAQMRDALAGQQAGSEMRGSGTGLILGLGGDGRQPVEVVLAPGSVLPVMGGPGSGKSSFLQILAILNGDPPRILWLDDAASLTQSQLQEHTWSLAAGATIVAAFPYPGPALSMLPMEWGLRTAAQGIVLVPQRPGDADLFGVRLDTAGAEPPGRGVLLDRGRRIWFQFPLAPEMP